MLKVNKRRLKLFCLIVALLNIISASLGVLYYALLTTMLLWLWNLLGIIMLISWLFNIILIYLNDRMLVKTDSLGQKINRLCVYFLAYMIVAMLLFFFYCLTVSFIDAFPIINMALPIVSLVGIALFGIVLAYSDLKNLENKGVWKFE